MDEKELQETVMRHDAAIRTLAEIVKVEAAARQGRMKPNTSKRGISYEAMATGCKRFLKD
jgi:hypothetical protein